MKKHIFIILLLIITSCSLFQRTPVEVKAFMNLTENFKELRYISNKDTLDRMDIAYLFALYSGYDDSKFENIPLDMKLRLYPSLAYNTINNKIMHLFPDSTFKPNEYVQKYQLAIFFTRYLSVIDPFFDFGLKDISIIDVETTFFAYKPINIVITRNIMELDKDGNFYPYKYISGKEALKYFYRIKSFYQ